MDWDNVYPTAFDYVQDNKDNSIEEESNIFDQASSLATIMTGLYVVNTLVNVSNSIRK